MNLPNPFINCSAASAMMEQSTAAPDLSDPPVAAVEKFNSALPSFADTAVASHMPPAPEAAAVVLTVVSLPARLDVTDAAGAPATPVPAAFSSDDTDNIHELFSAYAYRNSMHIISPPRDAGRIGLAAVHRALNLHPRDLDLDPPPLFLRKPRPAFLRALLQLAGDAR